MTIKTYTRVGTASLNPEIARSDNLSGTRLKVANSADREAHMPEHQDIKFIDLPYPMDKYHAAQYALTMPGGVWTDDELVAIAEGLAKAFTKNYS